MENEPHFRRLERMYVDAPINRFYRPAISIAEGSAEIVNPVREEFHHAADAVHGSVLFKLLDDAAFFAVSSLVDDVFVLTVSFNLYFVRPVADGELTASGRVIHSSRRLFVAEAAVADSGGRVVARGSGSFMRSRIELGPEVGYQ